jgi:hypothetical protein
MTLNPVTNFPTSRHFVLKLHRDAASNGCICGRLENIHSGSQFDFHSGAELLSHLFLQLAEEAFQTQDKKL